MKSVKSFRANNISDLEENEIREKEFIHQFTEFYENGLPKEVTTYNPDGTIEHKYEYQYNAEGKVINELLIESDGEVTEHRSMVYDAEGKLAKEFIHYLDDSADVLMFTYDSEGRLLSRRSIDNEGETGSYLVNVYSANHLVSETEYDIAGEIITQRKIVYDENDKIAEEIFRTPEQDYHVLYSYDENGTASVSRKYNEDKHLTERNTFTYNAEGRLSESVEETSSGIEITYIKYDEAGNVVLQEEKSEDGDLLSSIERTYDSANRLLTTSVLSQRPGPNAPQHYRIRYEFEF